MRLSFSSDSLRCEIESANARFMTVFGQQDAAGLSELYTSDCKLMPSGCDVVEGKGGEVGRSITRYRTCVLSTCGGRVNGLNAV